MQIADPTNLVHYTYVGNPVSLFFFLFFFSSVASFAVSISFTNQSSIMKKSLFKANYLNRYLWKS